MSVSYPVRTPLLYWAVVGALVVIALFGLAAFILGLARGGFGLLDVLALLLVAVPIVYIATTAEYRANGTIQLAAGEVVVPDERGRPLTLRSPGLRIAMTRVTVRVRLNYIPVGDVDRGMLVEFADATHVRRISNWMTDRLRFMTMPVSSGKERLLMVCYLLWCFFKKIIWYI